MPNEIYHRSNWGESKAEDFGDVYYDHAATNKLYNHSDYYENSDGTDATLKDLNNKASIVLTPTAYSDGSLNTVIPPYQLLSELVTNGDFSDGSTGWTSQSDVTFGDGTVSMDSTSLNAYINQDILTVGSKYRVSITVDALSITDKLDLINGSGIPYKVLEVGTNNFDIIATGNGAFRIRTKDGATSTISSASVKEIQEADFDFSRGSSATRVNEQGLVEDVQILSGELVQNGDFEQIGSELVTNGNFETDSDWSKDTGWSIANGKASQDGTGTGNDGDIIQNSILDTSKIYKIVLDVVDYTQGTLYIDTSNIDLNVNEVGTYTLYFTPSSTNLFIRTRFSGFIGSIDNVSVKEVGQNWIISGDNFSIVDGALRINRVTNTTFIQQNVLTSGKKYKVEFDVLDKADNSGNFTVRLGSNNVYSVSDYEGTKFSKTLTSSGTDFRIYSSSNNGVIYVDNVSVIEITDDTDLPRIDFTDGTGSLLLEPQRTNLVTYSEDFSDSSWNLDLNASYITRTPNAATSPSGENNATKLIGNNTSRDPNNSYIGASTSASAPYASSIFAKKGEYDYLVLGIGSYAGGYYAIFNLSNGTISTSPTASGTTASIEDYGNGWFRCIIATTNTSGSEILFISPSVDGTLTTNYTNTTNGVYVWGAQLEEGSYATSYIVSNSGSTTTRSADVANNSGNADLFNDSEGVLYAEVERFDNDTAFLSISISDLSVNNNVSFKFRNTTNLMWGSIKSGGVQTALMQYTSTNLTTLNKIALKYKENDFALWFNGVQVLTDTSGAVPTGIEKLSLDNGVGNEEFRGKVKCVAVFKEALSNDLLERLTGEGYESFRLLAEANNYTII